MRKWLKKSMADKLLDILIHAMLTLISLITFYIFWYCIVGAFSTGDDFMNGKSWFWPKHFTLDNFKAVVVDSDFSTPSLSVCCVRFWVRCSAYCSPPWWHTA